MSDEKKIFIVEQEKFSQYHVVGIFTTRQKADEYLRGYNLAHNLTGLSLANVVERELDPEYDVPIGYYVVNISGTNPDAPFFTPILTPIYNLPSSMSFAQYGKIYPRWTGQGFGRTVEEALKSAQDQVEKYRMLQEKRT